MCSAEPIVTSVFPPIPREYNWVTISGSNFYHEKNGPPDFTIHNCNNVEIVIPFKSIRCLRGNMYSNPIVTYPAVHSSQGPVNFELRNFPRSFRMLKKYCCLWLLTLALALINNLLPNIYAARWGNAPVGYEPQDEFIDVHTLLWQRISGGSTSHPINAATLGTASQQPGYFVMFWNPYGSSSISFQYLGI